MDPSDDGVGSGGYVVVPSLYGLDGVAAVVSAMAVVVAALSGGVDVTAAVSDGAVTAGTPKGNSPEAEVTTVFEGMGTVTVSSPAVSVNEAGVLNGTPPLGMISGMTGGASDGLDGPEEASGVSVGRALVRVLTIEGASPDGEGKIPVKVSTTGRPVPVAVAEEEASIPSDAAAGALGPTPLGPVNPVRADVNPGTRGKVPSLPVGAALPLGGNTPSVTDGRPFVRSGTKPDGSTCGMPLGIGASGGRCGRPPLGRPNGLIICGVSSGSSDEPTGREAEGSVGRSEGIRPVGTPVGSPVKPFNRPDLVEVVFSACGR